MAVEQSMMLAAYRTEYVGPDGLVVESLPRPTPGKGETLVRVRYTTVNRTDVSVLSGEPPVMRLFTGLRHPKLPIPGTDFAGHVVSVGEGVDFREGDRVYGFHDDGLATHAEFVVVPQRRALLTIPAGVSYAVAAASLEGAHYAVNFLRNRVIDDSKCVMVNGGTGGIGSALIQIVKSRGAYVVATCRSKDIEKVRALGADEVIDFETTDFTQQSPRFDVVFDAVGKSCFGRAKRILKPQGIYLSSELGPRAENVYLPFLTRFFGQRVVFPFPRNILGSMHLLRPLLAAGEFRPLIDRTYPLTEIADAFRYVQAGEKLGNVLIEMPSS